MPLPGITATAAPFVKGLLRDEPVRWPSLDPDGQAALIDALIVHGGAGLVYEKLRHGTAAAAPAEFVAAMAEESMAVAARTALRVREFSAVFDALNEVEIEWTTLKGIALLATVYDNPSLRPMVDLDLLVTGASLPQARDALLTLGFKQSLIDAPDHFYHWSFTKIGDAGMPLLVEVHQRLFEAAALADSLSTEQIIADRRRASIGLQSGGAFTDLFVPSPAHMLLHVAAHLSIQHAGGERLIWVADVDRICRRWSSPGFWESTFGIADPTPLGAALRTALEAAHAWFGTELPDLESFGGREGMMAASAGTYRRARQRAPVGREGAKVLEDALNSKGAVAGIRLALAYAFPSPKFMLRWYKARAWQLPWLYIRRLLRGLMDIVTHQRLRGRARVRDGNSDGTEPPPGDNRGDADLPHNWMIEP